MILYVDEEVQGFHKEFDSSADLLSYLSEVIDERVCEIRITKKDPLKKGSSFGSIQKEE